MANAFRVSALIPTESEAGIRDPVTWAKASFYKNMIVFLLAASLIRAGSTSCVRRHI